MLSIKKIVNHKFFFNFVIILSLIHNIMFIAEGSYNCIFIFIALSFIFNYFLNNPKINLLLSIVFTNIFFGCKKMKEGLENKDEEDDDDDEDDEEEDDEDDEDDEEEKKKKMKKIKKKIEKEKEEKKNILESVMDSNKKKVNMEGLLNKFNKLKNNKDAAINPQALSAFMNMNKKISKASSDDEFHNIKNLLKNNKETIKKLIDVF